MSEMSDVLTRYRGHERHNRHTMKQSVLFLSLFISVACISLNLPSIYSISMENGNRPPHRGLYFLHSDGDETVQNKYVENTDGGPEMSWIFRNNKTLYYRSGGPCRQRDVNETTLDDYDLMHTLKTQAKGPSIIPCIVRKNLGYTWTAKTHRYEVDVLYRRWSR